MDRIAATMAQFNAEGFHLKARACMFLGNRERATHYQQRAAVWYAKARGAMSCE